MDISTLFISFYLLSSALAAVVHQPDAVCVGKQLGEPFVYEGAYVECILENDVLVLGKLIGCISPSGGAPVKDGEKDPKTGATCYFDGRSKPFLATGDLEGCRRKGKADFIEGHLYKRCVLTKEKNSQKITKKVVACVRKLSSLEKLFPQIFKDRVDIGQTATINIEGIQTKYTCVRVKDSAKIVTEIHEDCEGRKVDEIVKINNSLKKCVIRKNNLESKPLACLFPLAQTSDLTSKSVLKRYVDPKTQKTFAQFALGEIFNGEELSTPVAGRCDLIAGEARFNQGDYYTCQGKGNKEFIEDYLYKRCSLDRGVYQAEVLACHVDWRNISEYIAHAYRINRIEIGQSLSFTAGFNNLVLSCVKRDGSVHLLQQNRLWH